MNKWSAQSKTSLLWCSFPGIFVGKQNQQKAKEWRHQHVCKHCLVLKGKCLMEAGILYSPRLAFSSPHSTPSLNHLPLPPVLQQKMKTEISLKHFLISLLFGFLVWCTWAVVGYTSHRSWHVSSWHTRKTEHIWISWHGFASPSCYCWNLYF